MDLRTYLRAIRKGWWLVLIFVIVGGGIAEFRNARATPIYAAHVTFYVSTPLTSGSANAATGDQFAQRRTNSYVELLGSQRLANAILAKYPSIASDVVMGEISGLAEPNTVLLKATVKDPSPARALVIANAVATTFPAMVNELDNSLQQRTVQLNVVSGPSVGHTPIAPRKSLNLLFGLGVGLLLGLLVAVLREVRDTTMRSAEALRGASKLPVIGDIPFDKYAKKAPLIVGDQLRSRRAEALRQLRTNLQFVEVDNPAQVLVVTSSIASEGKSSTSANLALVFAEADRRVLLIEADLRRPKAMDYLGIERSIGLTNVLAGQVRVDDVLQSWGSDGLMVLPSGSIPPNPSELLGSRHMADLITSLRQRFDMIIIDTPPLLPVTDGAVASVLADGVVVVVRNGRTTRAQLQGALESLESVDARVFGCVLTMTPVKRTVVRGYGYYEYKAAETAGARPPATVKVANGVTVESDVTSAATHRI